MSTNPSALSKALFATAISCPSGWQLPAHRHDDHHETVLVIEGRVETRMEGAITISPPGGMKFHPRRIDHAERALDGSPVKLLLVAWREAPGTDYLRWPRVSRRSCAALASAAAATPRAASTTARSCRSSSPTPRRTCPPCSCR